MSDVRNEGFSEQVYHPDYYNREGAMETWDEMEMIYGTRATALWCVMTAHKYRGRMLDKTDPKVDREKADNYMNKANELRQKIREGKEIPPMFNYGGCF